SSQGVPAPTPGDPRGHSGRPGTGRRTSHAPTGAADGTRDRPTREAGAPIVFSLPFRSPFHGPLIIRMTICRILLTSPAHADYLKNDSPKVCLRTRGRFGMTRSRGLSRPVLTAFCLCLLFSGSPLLAQRSDRAIIGGVVTDPQGAA